MSIPIRGLIPLLSVKSVPASIAFYERLGFRNARTHTPEGDDAPVWAWLTGDDCSLMIGESDEPVTAKQSGLIIYMYVDVVAAKHAELKAAGVEVSEITYPFWSKGGEFGVKDLDGYTIMIAHTGR
jgi:catechol 2,3-dioxygenase-like lactoylglutathione lyase family enzyme